VKFDVAAGAPFDVGTNSTKVSNLNADLLDGVDSVGLSGGMTYTHWGATSCGSGWTAVSTGTAVMVVERQNWGRAGSVLCYEGGLSGSESAGLQWSYQTNCSYRGPGRSCAVCAPNLGPGRPAGQCFNKWGASTCPSGWTAMYDGWIATAMEGNNWGDQGETVCMEKSALSCNAGSGGTGLAYQWANNYNLGSGQGCTVCCR
jgi:hypothetical protein